jgi:LL-diaminopimelate aminotransferase
MINIEYSNTLTNLPPYLFVKIDKLKQEELSRGANLIDLGIGDPDRPTPQHIIDAINTAVKDPSTHRYPSSEGLLNFRTAAANWYHWRFNIKLDSENEIIALIGSKEGIGHMPFAFINPGDIVLVPDPGYPVYKAATILAGGIPYSMPLLKENSFLPDLSGIDKQILNKAKLMFLNYPNNPTGASCNLEFFQHVVEIADKYNIIVCHDMAYSEIYYDNKPPHSFLEVDGAKEVGIEFFSLSKTYQMAGWRIGFAIGNHKIISGLLKIKSNLDSGVFEAIQRAAATALSSSQECVANIRSIYQERRDILVEGLTSIGWNIYKPMGTFYLWISIPNGYSSEDFSMELLKKYKIVTTPGNGFGEYGRGYIRMALTVEKEELIEVIRRIKNEQI